MRYINIIYAAAAGILLAGCTQDVTQQSGSDVSDDEGVVTFTAETVTSEELTRSSAATPDAIPMTGKGTQLWLIPTVTDTESTTTRGTQIGSVNNLNNFGVSAYKHSAIPSGKTLNQFLSDNKLTPNFFYKKRADKVTGTQKFKLTQDYYWPGDDEVLSFFAYAPFDDDNVVLSSDTLKGPQKINFTVNTNVKQQVDFMTAQASSTAHTNTSQTPSVQLNFQHQLAAIRFIVGEQFLEGYVKKITLNGVYTKGVYTIGGGWTMNPSDKGNFSISYSMDKHVNGTQGETVTAADETFLMIPETFAASDTANIEVTYYDNHTDYKVKAPLKNTSWQAGKTITYEITSKKLTTLKISSIGFPAVPSAASGMSADAKKWRTGDKVGMYVVSSDGSTIKHRNIPVTATVTNNVVTWAIDHTTSQGTVYCLPNQQYFFYYPYRNVDNGQPSGYPETCPSTSATAEAFFEGVIQGFTVQADQSNFDNFVGSDLMVGKGATTGYASTISVSSMARQVGIAVISLASKTITHTITYTNNGSASNSGSYTIAASSKFNTSRVPIANGNKYYYFTKVGGTTTFNNKSGEKYYWKNALNFNLAKNTAQEQTAQTDVEWSWTYVKLVYNYTYTDWPWEFTAPLTGTYTMECKGYGTSSAKGGYIKATKSLSANTKLIVYVGGLISSNYYFNLNGSSDIRTRYLYYTHALTSYRYFYGPYWNGGTGTYQWDEKGSNLQYATVDCCINAGNIPLTVSNLKQVSSHLSATCYVDGSKVTTNWTEFRFTENSNYPISTKSVVSTRESRLVSAGGIGNGNGVWNSTTSVSSSTGYNNGNGSVSISISRL